MKKLVVLAIAAAAAWGGWTWWKGRGDGEGEGGWKSVEAGRGDIVQTVTANGQLSAVKTVDVGSEVSGKVTALYADYNSTVTNGQLLARVDASSYLRQREQAEAEVESAEASLKLAEANFRRAEELREAELVSQSDYDEAEAQAALARASLRMRKASLDKVKVDLEKTEIYSPIDGVVISRSVDEGQTVAASMTTPVFFTLAQDLREMRIEAEISEADVGGVEEGQEVNFTVDAYPGRSFAGVVRQVRYEPVTSQNVVNYKAIVEVDNADLKLRPGMTANANVVTAKRTGVVRLPNAALRFRPPEGAAAKRPEPGAGGGRNGSPAAGEGAGTGPGEASPLPPPGGKPPELAEGVSVKVVWVEGAEGLEGRPVGLGITDGSWTEVLWGLEEGARVVTGKGGGGDTAKGTAPQRPGGGSPFMPGPPPR